MNRRTSWHFKECVNFVKKLQSEIQVLSAPSSQSHSDPYHHSLSQRTCRITTKETHRRMDEHWTLSEGKSMLNHNAEEKTLRLGDTAREWLYLWTVWQREWRWRKEEGVSVCPSVCQSVCVWQRALLSRLAEQWKSICHRETSQKTERKKKS